jgi:hypothetical protein
MYWMRLEGHRSHLELLFHPHFGRVMEVRVEIGDRTKTIGVLLHDGQKVLDGLGARHSWAVLAEQQGVIYPPPTPYRRRVAAGLEPLCHCRGRLAAPPSRTHVPIPARRGVG